MREYGQGKLYFTVNKETVMKGGFGRSLEREINMIKICYVKFVIPKKLTDNGEKQRESYCVLRCGLYYILIIPTV